MGHGARAGNDDGFRGNHERQGFARRRFAGGVNSVSHEIVNRNRTIKNRAGAENRAMLYDGSFVHAGIPSHEYVVFNDHRHCSHRFEHAADLRARGNMAVAADLRTTANKRVRIDHRAIADVRANIYEHRWHAHDAATDVRAVANARPTRYDAYTVSSSDGTNGIRGLVDERQAHRVDRHIHDHAHAKAEQDSFFHPGVDAPACGRGSIRLRRANFAAIYGVLELAEEPEVFFVVLSRRPVKPSLYLLRQHALPHAAAWAVTSGRVAVLSRSSDSITARMRASFSAFGVTSGRRHTASSKPISAMAAFTGMGFDSTKFTSISGCTRR